MSSLYLDAVKTLDVNGYQHLAGALIAFYDRQTTGMGVEQRSKVLAMFDELLAKYLGEHDTIHPTEILLSEDFTYLKALARTLQELELSPFELCIELTDEDLITENHVDPKEAQEFVAALNDVEIVRGREYIDFGDDD